MRKSFPSFLFFRQLQFSLFQFLYKTSQYRTIFSNCSAETDIKRLAKPFYCKTILQIVFFK